jgi:hypothetical protein
MKYPCEVIRDLLPLYIDGCCSEGSRRMVEEHLDECPTCKGEWEETTGASPLLPAAPTEELPEKAAAHTMKRGLKKVRRAWIASILAVILLIPVGKLAWNEYWGSGVCFTNLNELWIAHSFLADLKRGEYEKAFQRWDTEAKRERYLERWFDEETLANFDADAKAYFLSSAQQIIDEGGITGYQFISAELGGSDGDNWYRLFYKVTIGGKTYDVTMDVGNGGVFVLDGDGFLRDPDPLTDLGQWARHLWEHYEGCYMDFDLGEYVYENTPKS